VNYIDGYVLNVSTTSREESESMVFSWVTWLSRAVRDEAWRVMMQDPIMQNDEMSKLFDGKRMIFGGFRTIVEV
jgi:uncharacterized protein YbaA (DUF1428 family)